jgi:hypothetical protein
MIEVLAAPGYPGIVDSDAAGNQYFWVGHEATISPSTPLELTYSNRIWR